MRIWGRDLLKESLRIGLRRLKICFLTSSFLCLWVTVETKIARTNFRSADKKILSLRRYCQVSSLYKLFTPLVERLGYLCLSFLWNSHYHRFRWYATLENKTLAETFPKFPSIIRVKDMSDRNPPITATSLTFYVMLAGCDSWISIRHVDNTYDWWKFWKRFRECFVFQSRVSTKTVVMKRNNGSRFFTC